MFQPDPSRPQIKISLLHMVLNTENLEQTPSKNVYFAITYDMISIDKIIHLHI